MNKSNKKRGVVRTVLSEQIKEQLIEDIYYHKYKPGEKLVESALARELNVSQTSVREALRSLIAMGFLEGEPFKGITVRSLTKQDLWEVFTVRAALESLAARLAAERISEEELGELEELAEEMVEAGKEGDIARRTRINIDFHETMVRASGNKLILRLFRTMQFASWSMMTGYVSKMDPVEIAARHRRLIKTLREGNPDKASEAVREHIESVGKPVSEDFEEEQRANGGEQA